MRGFNVPYDQAIPGLKYYQLELQTIQRDIQVLITGEFSMKKQD